MPLDAVSLVQALAVDGDHVEGLLVVGLDRDRSVCGVAVNSRHRALSFVKVWMLEDLLRELEACSLVVGVFRHGSARAPTRHEVEAFLDLRARAHRAQVMLDDCILARGHETWSLRELAFVDLDQQTANRVRT
jgi:hypothetical protein